MGARRARAAWVSLVTGALLMAVKFVAWGFTGSAAVLSDAMESIVNVLAAGFALFSVRLASRPADRNHPYGHGKVEFFAAGFEGGLIALAAVLIVVEATRELATGAHVERIDLGLVLTLAAGVVNLILGWWLLREGRATESLALEADGKHVLTDVWTTAAVAFGLGLVWLTGWAPADPIVAIAAALNLLFIGARLVRRSVAGLMDERDPELVARATAVLARIHDTRMRGWDSLRCRRQGPLVHVDLTAYVRGEISVDDAHDLADRLEQEIEAELGEAEVIVHIEPASEAG